MAIDTTQKKMSLLNFGRGPGGPIVLPPADGSFNEADKLQFLHLYSGLAAAALILGPYCVEAGEVFVAGAVVGEVFMAGRDAGEVFVAGAEAGEVVCN